MPVLCHTTSGLQLHVGDYIFVDGSQQPNVNGRLDVDDRLSEPERSAVSWRPLMIGKHNWTGQHYGQQQPSKTAHMATWSPNGLQGL